MFINFSNHPSLNWSDKQIQEAKKWGEIVDVPFPSVPAQASETDIANLADKSVGEIMTYCPDVVMCQGEFTLAYAVIERLNGQGILTVAACSERIVDEYMQDGKQEKRVIFDFVKFREYR